MTEILLGSAVFTGLIMALTLIVLAARSILMPKGMARLTVNHELTIDADIGEKLLNALERGGIHLPTSCSGVGTCGLCRVTVSDASSALPIERSTLGESEIEKGTRLACQNVVRNDLAITIAPDLLVVETWSCSVKQTRFLSPLIKEIVFALPREKIRSFRAGSYVQITAPPFTLPFTDIAVDKAYKENWSHLGLQKLTARSNDSVSRAYSLANHPGETDILLLNIRLALPPGGQPDVPPGIVSSYLFGLGTGDTVAISGPYGNFFAADSDKEMILIGGGVGMAALRPHVFDQLMYRKSNRTISYWYGARSLSDLFYTEDMERLARDHENFSWHVALSDPAPSDAWTGATGFIHDVVYREHLKDHPDPGTCEYYLCGPPLMIEATRALLEKMDVAPDSVFYDDFGG